MGTLKAWSLWCIKMTPAIFIITCLLSLALLYSGTGVPKKHFLIFLCWQLFMGGLALNGVFSTRPGLFPLMILGTVILSILILRSIKMQEINSKILLGIHILRIPVELVLYQLAIRHKVPFLMTFKGWNFDILIGCSALILWIYILVFKKPLNKILFRLWNILGMAFLLFIVSLAILSSPLPIQQFGFGQPNIAVLEFPYCLLPSCIVPIVFIAHALLLKRTEP